MTGDGRGLRADGTIAREGALARVPPAFAAVVAAAGERIAATFPRAHSGYLYGSIPRGTAVPGRSDLDALVALPAPPTAADRAAVTALETALDAEFPAIDGAGIQLSDVDTLLGEPERYDGGFFVACLCTPLFGDDLARLLPRYRPTPILARETNGDLGELLPGWRDSLAGGASRVLARRVSRRIVRTAFTLVMPRWGGWTSDLDRSAAIAGGYYPERAGQLRTAAALARAPRADPAVLHMLIDDLGPWLATEYTAVHGPRTPR